MPRWKAFIQQHDTLSLNRQPEWLTVLASGLQHEPYCVEATVQDRIVGLLPLAYVSSFLFGKFLVSLPYINTAGIVADNETTAVALIDQAVALADRLRVKHLELRHEAAVTHSALTHSLTSKVHMRLSLPQTVPELWDQLHFKVRNKVRKGEKQGFTVHWGVAERLPEFYEVFSHNMRDLGTPVFSRKLFSSILECFPQQAELCVIRAGQQPIAVALLTHGNGSTEVPSASSLRAFGSTNANDFMYWQLLQRAIARGQRMFDFGRSTIDSNTYVLRRSGCALRSRRCGSTTLAVDLQTTCDARMPSTIASSRCGRSCRCG